MSLRRLLILPLGSLLLLLAIPLYGRHWHRAVGRDVMEDAQGVSGLSRIVLPIWSFAASIESSVEGCLSFVWRGFISDDWNGMCPYGSGR